MSKVDRTRKIQMALQVVEDVDGCECPLQAACIVSSVAEGDCTPESDVDILMVALDGQGGEAVQRRLIDGTVFEWLVVAKSELADVNAVLRDAGLTHDLRSAVILRDTTGWMAEVQNEILARYTEPESRRVRAAGQLHRLETAVANMAHHVDLGELLPAQRMHVSALKAVLGLPRAVLNKRCTMSRGLLFCRESALQLGWSAYLRDAVRLLGAGDLSPSEVRRLAGLAQNVIAAGPFTAEDKTIRIKHLGQAQWLLDHHEPCDAVWPLHFWSSANIMDAGGTDCPVSWRHWMELAGVLGVADLEGLTKASALAGEILVHATGLVNEFNSWGCPETPTRTDGV